MEKKLTDIYKIPPLRFVDSIPVFSEANEYTANYEMISLDHIAEMHKTGTNPFIQEDLWVELENSTKELILKYSAGKSRCVILDVGVGLGRLFAPLPTSFEKYGMDISMDYLKIAQGKGVNVCYSLVEDMPYKENFFDVVVCTDVLEHVLDLNLACAKILSVLKRNGILIVRVPYRENLSVYLSDDYPYKFVHIRNFDEHSLKLLFQKVFGCEVLQYKTIGYGTDYMRFKYALPVFIKISLSALIYCIKYVNKTVYKGLASKFYNPIEINVVVKKHQLA
ncbi:MAG: class I SAM-dependent methyltransferase [Chloroflexi bacterium]|nr:class I SAM-dependent methyltransferase [Chloroflexota bacterium]